MFNHYVNPARATQQVVKLIRIYPVITAVVLGVAYKLGAFTEKQNPLVPRELLLQFLYLYIGVIPLIFIAVFIFIGTASDKEARIRASENQKFTVIDAFDLPQEKMHGFKLSLLTGQIPAFTGLTGDVYEYDAQAVCSLNPDHVPPVAECECGFYAYKELRDAKFERSINPGSYLLDVDLFGIGFEYQRGYRAETQVVNSLIYQSRCMRCKVLPAKTFVKSFRLGFQGPGTWEWQLRCRVCSQRVDIDNKLSISQMQALLRTSLIEQ